MVMQLIILILEYLWNVSACIHSPVNYRLSPKGKRRVVARDLVVKHESKRLIFVSQQLLYERKGRLKNKRVRLYRVEVIEDSGDIENALSPSKIFIVPEMCGGVFKHTTVPHSCAINFVISKIT